MHRIWIALSLVGAAAAVGCQDAVAPAQSATIYFALDAPLCSSVLAVQLSLDSVVVVTDTFRVHVSNPDTTSRPIATTAGRHVLGARVIGGYVWPDTVVTVSAGNVLTRALPFYCS